LPRPARRLPSSLPDDAGPAPTHPPRDDFFFPPGATAPAALEATGALFASAEWHELLPYAPAIDTRVRLATTAAGEELRLAVVRRIRSPRLERWAAARYPRWAGDVLVVGECVRAAERAAMARLVEGLVRSGRSVLYLCVGLRERASLERLSRAAGWGSRVRLATVPQPRAAHELWLHPWVLDDLARDGRAIGAILAARGLQLGRDALPALRAAALGKAAWRILAGRLRFGTAIVRTRYMPLSAAVLAGCMTDDGPLTISFQHSIVTSPGSFTPCTAKRYAVFGEASRALLARLDAGLASTAGRAVICRDLVPVGSLVDPIIDAHLGRSRPASVLIVDQGSDWTDRHFGCGEEQRTSLELAARTLADRSRMVDRVVVRPHPFGNTLARWNALADANRDRIVISPPGRPIEAELGAASIVLGLFSTLLPVAAASGIPTLFVWSPGWFSTPDLAPFHASFVAPERCPEVVDGLLAGAEAYSAAQGAALAAGASYFAGRRTCAFEHDLVKRLLAALPEAIPGGRPAEAGG